LGQHQPDPPGIPTAGIADLSALCRSYLDRICTLKFILSIKLIGKDGFFLGLNLGALFWGAVTISLISISSAPLVLKTSWFAGQTEEIGIAALVIGYRLGEKNLRNSALLVSGFVLEAVVTRFIIQNV
jgi:hypothetical protein